MTSTTKANFINSEQLEELIANNKLVLVDYTATWCGPCKVVAPLMDRLATEYGDRSTVVKVDIDENRDSAKKYGIRSIPAVMVFRDGEVIENLFGSQPYEIYSNILETQIRL
ncbi:thioredoxin [Waterburya agarophytonicola K14]|uniref:Thioredoxin n=1 Tax=Waterburya agarophytonicola KI4 TaxID=2874699 RepID=A0A964FG88_9CYAN|nr:thioredoxin [Waterburya agarophytonicola]MCC0176278.1 thioredoxin [Waterburya agarophytonicola KI4]